MKVLTAILMMVVFLSGCASTQTPTPPPKPECQGAQIVGQPFETWGVFAVKEAWIGVIISKRVPKPVLKTVAQKAKTAAEMGTVDGLITVIASTASDLGVGDYALLIIPVADMLRAYNGTTLNVCDQKLLIDLFASLELISS